MRRLPRNIALCALAIAACAATLPALDGRNGTPLPLSSDWPDVSVRRAAAAEPALLLPLRREPPALRGLGRFQLSYYWMAEQQTRRRNTTLYDPSCRPVARVSRSFARRLALEGTGRLRDGRVLNVVAQCGCKRSPCVTELDQSLTWGVGVLNRPLSPFRSVAVDPRVVRIGTRLYVPALDGVRMPGRPPEGGFIHDGCVVADDRGGGVKGRQVDFFVGQRGYYRALHGKHPLTRVKVYAAGDRCAQLGQGAASNI